MADETPHDELVRLRKAQSKARQDEVYGGLTHAEQAQYNGRAARIRELEGQLPPSADVVWREKPGSVI